MYRQFILLLTILMLGGCVSLKELEQQRSECLGVVQVDGSVGCPDELHAEIDRRVARAIEREQVELAWKQTTYCPEGMVFVCQDDWCQKSKQRHMPRRRGMSSGCMPYSEVRRAFGMR